MWIWVSLCDCVGALGPSTSPLLTEADPVLVCRKAVMSRRPRRKSVRYHYEEYMQDMPTMLEAAAAEMPAVLVWVKVCMSM